MYKRCLTCGEPKADYKILFTGMFIAGTWIFAAILLVLIFQNRLIF
jgi:hypothetical protein